MRHITINLILIFAFLGSFAQNQQVLRNGFVAATDSGVYYLQDGFSEWVRLGIPSKLDLTSTGSFETMDTISGVGNYSTSSFSYNVEINEGIPQQFQWDGAYYGSHLFENIETTGAYSSGDFVTKNIIDFDYFGKGCIAYHHGTSNFGRYIVVNPNQVNAYSYSIEGTWINNINSFDIDTDTTVVFVGKTNTIYELEAAKLESNRSLIYVFGLHSRSTDSHKICYNPDEDEFIIVSDSGIVYSYDKTTITTIDTIYLSGYIYDKVNDLVYNENDQYYYIIMRRSSPDTNYAILMTNNFTSYKSIGLESDYPPVLAVGNPYTLSVDSGINVLITNPSIPSYDLFPELPDRVVFDLDYINYNP